MARIARKTQKQFGGSLTPTGNIAQWGSLQAAAPAFSDDPDTIQALAAWGNGFNGAVVGNRSPAQEDMNALGFVFAYQLAYILQAGLPEWDAGTNYFQLNYATRNGQLYRSKTDNNLANDPATDSNNWARYGDVVEGTRVAAASVVFDGINASSGNSRIISSDNVDHVVKNEDGSYTIVFSNAFPSANYVVAGTCGSEDGQAFGAGDDGVIVQNYPGKGNSIRSAAQCRIFTINPTDKSLVASGCVSVTFFALP